MEIIANDNRMAKMVLPLFYVSALIDLFSICAQVHNIQTAVAFQVDYA